MTKQEIKQDIKKKLGFDVGDNIRGDIQSAIGKLMADYLILQIATGFGKTKSALNAVIGKNVLIVHKQISHRTSWENEIEKWGFDFDITFSTYNSVKKVANNYDTVILDEVHGITPQRLYDIKQSTWSKLICLSATIPEDKMKMLYSFGKPKIVQITIFDSILWGVTPIPNIKVINYTLNSNTKNQLYRKGQDSTKTDLIVEYNDRFKYYSDRKINLVIRCTESEYYNLLLEDIAYWKKTYFVGKEKWQKNKWLGKTLERKNWLNHLKTDLAKKIIAKLQSKRFVVFTTDIAQCKSISGNKNAIHSENSESLELIDKFNNKTINSLFSVNMLTESINLVDLDCAVMVNLDASSILAAQKLGRAFRSKEPEMYVIKIPFTRDAEFFDMMKEQLKDDWFTSINLNMI